MSKIVGIDLGTTNTCVAQVSNKIPRVIPIEEGYSTMPSVVAFTEDGSVLVGAAAKEYAVRNPTRCIHDIKRLLGRQYNSRYVQNLIDRFSYDIVSSKDGLAQIKVGNTTQDAQTVQSKILQQIKRYAEIQLGEEIPEVVIAVPAYFSDSQRNLVKDAAKMAGWTVRRLVNEPTAAALAYGFNRGFNQKILVYDLGGGTFDISVLDVSDNVFQVVATGGDTFLGGGDFDNRILDWVFNQVQQDWKVDLSEEPGARWKVKSAAERAKIELSLLANTQVRIPELMDRRGKKADFEVVLSREELANITGDLVERTIELVDQTLASAGLRTEDISEIILVGGQTRMPLISDRIRQKFGKEPRKGLNPDECVALGAALLGDSLERIESVSLVDAVSVPIGIARGSSLEIVIPKNVQLPHKATFTQPTVEDDQERIQLDIYQGEPGPVANAHYLGTLMYDQLPRAPVGQVEARIEFALDAEGMLTVSVSNNQNTQPRSIALATVERPPPPQELVERPSTDAVQDPAEQQGSIGKMMRGLLGRK